MNEYILIISFQVLAVVGCGRLFLRNWIVHRQRCPSAQTLWKLWQTIKTWALQHLKKNLWKCVRKFFWNFLGETPVWAPKKSENFQFLEAHASLVLALSVTPSVFCLSVFCHTFPEFAVRSISCKSFQFYILSQVVPVVPSRHQLSQFITSYHKLSKVVKSCQKVS